ncbi:MAG: phosphatase PAP2 family protein [Monoglobales bacterium]
MTDFLLYLQGFSTPLLDNLFLIISALTGEYVYLVILGVIYWCVNKDKAYYIGIFLFISFALNSFLKNIFRVPRPYTYSDVEQIDLSTGYGYSFPSGHAQMSTTFSGMFSVIFRKKWIYVSGIILVFLTGISRMYLGVHTPADILCGTAIGLIITLTGDRLKEIKNPKILGITAFLITLGVSLLFPSEDNLKIMFFSAGFFSGNLLETKFIGYTIPKRAKMRAICGGAGLVLVVAGNVALKSIGLVYSRYLVLGLIITTLVPIIIKMIDRKGE